MKKNLVLLFGLLLMTLGCNAQLYPVFSQYYFNELMINPAYAGAHVQFSATATYRNQWINFPGAPQTYSFTAHSSFLRGKIGAGIMVDEDKIGSYANQDVIVAGSYKIKFPKSTLSFGLQGTAYFIKADFSSLNLSAPDPNFASYNQVKPNIGAGIYYNKKKFFVGFSVPYLINTKFSSQAEIASQLRQYRNYFLRSGFIQDLSRNVKINPSILIRQQQGQPVSLDVNTSFIFYDLAAAGVSWRSGDSLIGFISLQLFQNFYFNYSFDFTTSDLAPFSAGTQEFMINYRAKINSVHKNLSCPNIYSYRE